MWVFFPEQAVNWEYISESISMMPTDKPIKFLNLFAYTGAASMAGKAAGADTTHLDSIKQVVNWANENQQLSGLKGHPLGSRRCTQICEARSETRQYL
jgi:23S rRNA (cytosine1962-C5)-methyltransferase